MQENSRFDLSGKVAIVTGSSKGIGLAIAEGLAQNGAKVVVSSRKQEAVEAVANELVKKGWEAIGIQCHIGDAEQRQALVDQTLEKWGRIDILVNNAAVNPFYGPLENTEAGIFDKIVDINIKAPWLLSNLVQPHMVKQGGGSIINISSVEGLHPGFGLGLYSMSKAALLMLTKNQAKEWGPHGIRVNALCPGLIKTKFSESLWTNEKLVTHIEKSLPLKRIALPEEMVGTALLLASDAGSYITGGTFVADGGYLIAGQ